MHFADIKYHRNHLNALIKILKHLFESISNILHKHAQCNIFSYVVIINLLYFISIEKSLLYIYFYFQFSSVAQSCPTEHPSQHQSPFQWVNSSHEVAKVLEFQLQHQSFQWIFRTDLYDGLVGTPCSPKDSQELAPTPQFKSINSLALSLLHSPNLTSIHDHRKNHSLDYTDLSRHSDVSAFEYTI